MPLFQANPNVIRPKNRPNHVSDGEFKLSKPEAPALKAHFRKTAPLVSSTAAPLAPSRGTSAAPTHQRTDSSKDFSIWTDEASEGEKRDGSPLLRRLRMAAPLVPAPTLAPAGAKEGFRLATPEKPFVFSSMSKHIKSMSFLDDDSSEDGSPRRRSPHSSVSSVFRQKYPQLYPTSYPRPIQAMSAWGDPFEVTLLSLGKVRSPQKNKNDSPMAPLLYASIARRGLSIEPTYLFPIPEQVDGQSLVEARPLVAEIRKNYEELIIQATEESDPSLAEAHLRDMIIEWYAGTSKQAPDGLAYNLVLHAYANKGDAEKAESILKLAWEDYEQGNRLALPNTRCYTSCMYAWQKSSNKYVAPEENEKLLREMYQLYTDGKAPQCKPDLFTYTCVLHSWADSKREDAAKKAHALFRLMLDRFDKGETDLKPDNVCYSNLINAYVQAGHNQISNAEHAETLFWEMVDRFTKGNLKAAPTTRNFNTILAAWSKIASPKSAIHAENMIHRWEELNTRGGLKEVPDAYSYSLLLKAWYVDSSNFPYSDCPLFHLMCILFPFHRAQSPREDAMPRLLLTTQRLRHKQGVAAAHFDAIKYATVIGALARAGMAQKAHTLLLEMVAAFEKSRNYKDKPDAKIFHAVMAAWACHEQADHGANMAVDLLGRLWALSKRYNGPKPSSMIYKVVIASHEKANAPHRASDLLREMVTRQGFLGHTPDEGTYRSVLKAWTRSNDKDKKNHIKSLMGEIDRLF
jgi:pentatricopeptide repeat protein